MFRWASVLLVCASVCAAEKPALEQLFPSAGLRGATNEITLLGKYDPWPPKAWASLPGLDFQFSTNKGKAQLIISSNTPTGPCLVRFFNEQGPSDCRILVITDLPELTETEPNGHFAHPQTITNLPVTMNGRLEKNGDVDCFAIQMRAGDWLDATLDSYKLFAKLDPVLRLVTTNGFQLAWNHDFGSLDPRLVWQAPYDLTAVIQVFGFAYPADSDIRLSGGPSGVYRLKIASSPEPPADYREVASEREPNDKDAPVMDCPSVVIGAINPEGDIDRFQTKLAAGQNIEAKIEAAALGSTLDAWLAIEDSAGKELKRNDDADNSSDPRIEWKAPADGNYFFRVGSLTHRGGPDYRYHLALRTLEPDFRLTSSADAVECTPGMTNSLKLSFARLRGFTNELTAAATNLPPGVTVSAVPLKDGDISLEFITATNAAPAAGPFQVFVTDKSTGQVRAAAFEMVSRTENNGVPGGYSRLLVETNDQIWLTIKPPEKK